VFVSVGIFVKSNGLNKLVFISDLKMFKMFSAINRDIVRSLGYHRIFVSANNLVFE